MKGIINIIVRSQKEKEVSPGIFKYDYTAYKNVPANCPNDLSYTHFDTTSINPERKLSNDFTFIFANDATDRANRIDYIEYRGVVYKVERIVPYPPRVRVSIGGSDSRTLEEIISEGL